MAIADFVNGQSIPDSLTPPMFFPVATATHYISPNPVIEWTPNTVSPDVVGYEVSCGTNYWFTAGDEMTISNLVDGPDYAIGVQTVNAWGVMSLTNWLMFSGWATSNTAITLVIGRSTDLKNWAPMWTNSAPATGSTGFYEILSIATKTQLIPLP